MVGVMNVQRTWQIGETFAQAISEFPAYHMFLESKARFVHFLKLLEWQL